MAAFPPLPPSGDSEFSSRLCKPCPTTASRRLPLREKGRSPRGPGYAASCHPGIAPGACIFLHLTRLPHPLWILGLKPIGAPPSDRPGAIPGAVLRVAVCRLPRIYWALGVAGMALCTPTGYLARRGQVPSNRRLSAQQPGIPNIELSRDY